MKRDLLEELIKTIEVNAIDNKATITNVTLWAESWRKEVELEALTPTAVGCRREQLVCEYGYHNKAVLKYGYCHNCEGKELIK